MGSHFYGYAINEHGERDIKDMSPFEKFLLILFAVMVVATIPSFLLGIGILVIMIGLDVLMMCFVIRRVMRAKSIVLLIFDALGILTVIAGIIVMTCPMAYLIIYAYFVYLLICFGVGGGCLYAAIRKQKKIRSYNLIVNGVCEIVDQRRLNLFRFDDISPNPFASINQTQILKPAFHYYVNGQEYYTESTVYYGDLNKGFQDGATVTLRVDPKDPTKILPRGEGVAMELLMGIIWTVIGFFCIAAGIIFVAVGGLDTLFYIPF